MTVGSLGSDVIFSISDKEVKTISNMSWKSSVSYSVHKLHLRKGLLEYTGEDPEEIEFEAQFSAFLGVNPLAMCENVRRLMKSRTVVPFILGTDVIGSKWVVTDFDVSADSFFQDGTIVAATAKIKIKEYGEE